MQLSWHRLCLAVIRGHWFVHFPSLCWFRLGRKVWWTRFQYKRPELCVCVCWILKVCRFSIIFHVLRCASCGFGYCTILAEDPWSKKNSHDSCETWSTVVWDSDIKTWMMSWILWVFGGFQPFQPYNPCNSKRCLSLWLSSFMQFWGVEVRWASSFGITRERRIMSPNIRPSVVGSLPRKAWPSFKWLSSHGSSRMFHGS